MQPKKICTFGSFRDLCDSDRKDIIKLGKMLAEKGFTVVSGGFGGTMEDILRGAKLGGGKTVGVTFYRYEDINCKKANKFVDEEIVAKDIFERIFIMIKNCDAFIIFPGGTGTFFELAAVLEHINKGLIEPKPIIAIGDYWKTVMDSLKCEQILNKKIKAKYCNELVTFVKDANEAVKRLETFFK